MRKSSVSPFGGVVRFVKMETPDVGASGVSKVGGAVEKSPPTRKQGTSVPSSARIYGSSTIRKELFL